MVSKLLIISLVCLSLGSSVLEESPILGDTDAPWNYLGFTGYSGFINMNGLTGSSLFYWLFECVGSNITSDKIPIVIWLQGGPGCSSELGMLFENISPITFNPFGQPVGNPELTWATNYHIMSIDFPYGAGFSYANSANDERPTTLEATAYLYRFLTKLNTKYPTWFNRKVYIFGESYGGHWVPGIAYNILQNNAFNAANGGWILPLQGIGIGDPWVDASTQSQTYGSYAYSTSLINNNELSIVNYYQNLVAAQLSAGQYLQAEANWENSYGAVISFSGGVNEYNIRLYSQYNYNYIGNWLNKPSTKTLLNVPQSASWVDCNDTVYDYYRADIMNTTVTLLPYILSQNVSVLIYNGQDDLIVNTPGIENMMARINWPGAANFASAPKINWSVDGNLAGYAQEYNNLTFVLVLASGHLAPHDQPVNVKDMVNRYITREGWN